MTEIVLTDLTTKSLDGTGVFDELMTTVQLRLADEFKKNRIKTPDYSKVFLGALDTTMQQSLAYLMGRQTADAQAELLKAQKDLAVQELANSVLQGDLLTKQSTKLDSEIALLGQQLTNITNDNLKTTAETSLISQNIQNAITTNATMVKQQAKLDSEKSLLDQKVFTEQAQILDMVDDNTVVGIVGAQKSLYDKQKDGFDRDAEQKAAKILVDSWNIRKSMDIETKEVPAGLSDANIRLVVQDLQEGLSISPIVDVDP